MNRRTFLASLTGVGTVALAGCLGSDESRFTLSVADYDFGENEDGYLEAWATVSNVGNERQAGTLYFHGDLNGEPLVRVRDVELDGHETRKYTVTYDVKWEDVRSYSIEVEIEPRDD
jgi:hypothetical protein